MTVAPNNAYITQEKLLLASGLLCLLGGCTMALTGCYMPSFSHSTSFNLQVFGLTVECIGIALVLYAGKDLIKETFENIFSKAKEQFKIDQDDRAENFHNDL